MDGIMFYAIATLSFSAVLLVALAILGIVAIAVGLFVICRKVYNYIKRPRAFEVDLTGVRFK